MGSSCACLEVLRNSKAASNRLTLPSAAYFVGYWYEINYYVIITSLFPTAKNGNNELIITYYALLLFSLLHYYYPIITIITHYYMLQTGQLADVLGKVNGSQNVYHEVFSSHLAKYGILLQSGAR